MIGKNLGKWHVEKELGRGGMGRVYLARHTEEGRPAAVKVLAAELAKDAGFLHRFQREIEALQTLDHPNIVKLYESGYENELYFYAMEYVEGASLQDLLDAQGRLPWMEVLSAAQQICPALKHAHDHGIIHRDLKPPNLLRTHDGTIKLTDFGIAKVFASTHLTAAGGVVGTAEYLSPEQASGKPATKRSDLYSLGVVLYVLLTGRTPFDGESFVELLHKHCYAQFDRPIKIVPEIPHELDEAVCQLLEKDPANRPADCGVFARQLAVIRRKLDRRSEGTEAGVRHDDTVGGAPPTDGSAGPGPATVMSRLVRAELERRSRPTSVAHAVNRIWVLLPLFLLCVGTIAWAFWPASADSLFWQGSELMASDDPAAWDRAWTEYLKPLNERFPDHPYRAEVEHFQHWIEVAREPQRIYQQGGQYLRVGNSVAAVRIWKDLIAVYGTAKSPTRSDPAKPWVARAEKELAELEKPSAEKAAAIRAALRRASKLWEVGQRQKAEQIWDGLEDLYRDDYTARDLLKEVREARQKK
jgi:predicted Ser/Thr protein kinase